MADTYASLDYTLGSQQKLHASEEFLPDLQTLYFLYLQVAKKSSPFSIYVKASTSSWYI